MGQCEYHLAKACIDGGLEMIHAYRNQLKETRKKIGEVCDAGGQVVIWAANRVCDELLEGFHLPETAMVVDSNPRKSDYLERIPVYPPQTIKEVILRAQLIVFCSSLYSDEIINFIREKMGRVLSPDEMMVIYDN